MNEAQRILADYIGMEEAVAGRGKFGSGGAYRRGQSVSA